MGTFHTFTFVLGVWNVPGHPLILFPDMDPKKGVSRISLYAPLDVPASIFFGTGKGERTSIFVTNQGIGNLYFPDLPWAGPGLVKVDAGVPGRPLH